MSQQTRRLFDALLHTEFIDQELINSMKAWQHSGFHVYAAEPISPDDEDARMFLARYLKKAPLSLERLEIDDSGLEPTVRYSKQLDDGSKQTREFSPCQFLAELSLHIPKVFEQTTRYYGVYSCRTRGAKRRAKQQKNKKRPPL